MNLVKSPHNKLPGKGALLQFATLFDYTPENLGEINEALQLLQDHNIPYLNVCCTRHDAAYQLLKPLAMNVLPYIMLSTFAVQNGQKLTLDVRCL